MSVWKIKVALFRLPSTSCPTEKPKTLVTGAGIELDVFGNGEEYNIHLRTDDLTQPWQSYRQSFRVGPQWQTVQFRFQDFTPYRTDIALDVRRLRRIGIVAIGRAFSADICVGGLRYMAP
jgi:hypothetical protein